MTALTAAVKIAGLATYVPPRVLTNADLEKLVETTDEWILQRTGIRERHIVEPGRGDVGPRRARRAGGDRRGRHHAGRHRLHRRRDDDARHDLPEHGVHCCRRRSARRRAWGFDLGAACSGFTYALTIGVASMVATGAHDHALVVGADVMSSIIDYTDRATCILFGDGAGAVVLSPAEPGEPSIIDFAHDIDGGGGHALCMPAGGSRLPASHETVDAAAALRQAGWADRVQVRGEEDGGDLPAAARPQRPHARTTSTSSCRTRPTGASSRPRPSGSASIRRRSSSTSIATATRRRRRFRSRSPTPCAAGRLKKGDLVLLASVGAGFTVGSVLLRWGL